MVKILTYCNVCYYRNLQSTNHSCVIGTFSVLGLYDYSLLLWTFSTQDFSNQAGVHRVHLKIERIHEVRGWKLPSRYLKNSLNLLSKNTYDKQVTIYLVEVEVLGRNLSAYSSLLWSSSLDLLVRNRFSWSLGEL